MVVVVVVVVVAVANVVVSTFAGVVVSFILLLLLLLLLGSLSPFYTVRRCSLVKLATKKLYSSWEKPQLSETMGRGGGNYSLFTAICSITDLVFIVIS